MLTRQQAKIIAFEGFKNANGFADIAQVLDLYVIQDDLTRELDYGWVFIFTTKQFLETGDYRDGLGIGMGPILVTEDGDAVSLGTWGSLDQLIAAYVANTRHG